MTTIAALPPQRPVNPDPASSSHLNYIRRCLSLAEKSPPRPSNFRVGAMLVLRRDEAGPTDDDTVLSTGYTLELTGNTHAEQCCLSNYAAVHGVPEERIGEALPSDPSRKVIMYVTMEPCGHRLSGNTPCVQRIIRTRQGGHRGIDKVYFGVKEPGTFVGESQGCKMLTEAGVEWEHIGGLEEDIVAVATAGHEKKDEERQESRGGTNIDDISAEERRRQELLPRNPKKRMMDTSFG
jgi:pyrimidine deaminase RibD-like protein